MTENRLQLQGVIETGNNGGLVMFWMFIILSAAMAICIRPLIVGIIGAALLPGVLAVAALFSRPRG